MRSSTLPRRAGALVLTAQLLAGCLAMAAQPPARTPIPVPAVPSVPAAPAAPSVAGGAATTNAVAPGVWTLGDAFWDRPRSAEAIRLQPAVRAAVTALVGTPEASLVIRHGRGQNDGLRAEELRHWLVALAIEPGRIAIAPAGRPLPEALRPGDLVLELAR
jgi:hypothetical protein